MKGVNGMNTEKKKLISIAAVLFICISLFCSFAFITDHADHDCTHDENCAVCGIIDACINTINNSASVDAVFSVAAAVFLLCVFVLLPAEKYNRKNTLISLKVELRN